MKATQKTNLSRRGFLGTVAGILAAPAAVILPRKKTPDPVILPDHYVPTIDFKASEDVQELLLGASPCEVNVQYLDPTGDRIVDIIRPIPLNARKDEVVTLCQIPKGAKILHWRIIA